MKGVFLINRLNERVIGCAKIVPPSQPSTISDGMITRSPIPGKASSGACFVIKPSKKQALKK